MIPKSFRGESLDPGKNLLLSMKNGEPEGIWDLKKNIKKNK